MAVDGSVENRLRVIEKVLEAESTMQNDADVCVEQLCLIIIKASMTTETKKTEKLINATSMLKYCSYEVKVSFSLPDCPWIFAQVILNK